MPRRRTRHPDQFDLLGWEPSQPVVAFDPRTVRAASLAASISKAVSQSLKGRQREQIAERMSAYLDEQVSEHMLNAYASEARGEHIINVVRFIALVEATGDRRLLEFIAELFDWAVIERRYLPAIELAERLEKRAEMDRDIEAARRQLKRGGVL
ncbi:DNA transposition protein [Ancylobacter pratisalsi]|uniref:DNA transposition protein n=1 Tax=Ancylobacter pratisalsi TaxID=1745854 RepID=A0A6P1YRU8_9HYPH|nr:DNA transposition protein [Ancylobacter pratisalsi]QIB34783.1 DNA transposition protein [Ancylobacter pratisalsi]